MFSADGKMVTFCLGDFVSVDIQVFQPSFAVCIVCTGQRKSQIQSSIWTTMSHTIPTYVRFFTSAAVGRHIHLKIDTPRVSGLTSSLVKVCQLGAVCLISHLEMSVSKPCVINVGIPSVATHSESVRESHQNRHAARGERNARRTMSDSGPRTLSIRDFDPPRQLG